MVTCSLWRTEEWKYGWNSKKKKINDDDDDDDAIMTKEIKKFFQERLIQFKRIKS